MANVKNETYAKPYGLSTVVGDNKTRIKTGRNGEVKDVYRCSMSVSGDDYTRVRVDNVRVETKEGPYFGFVRVHSKIVDPETFAKMGAIKTRGEFKEDLEDTLMSEAPYVEKTRKELKTCRKEVNNEFKQILKQDFRELLGQEIMRVKFVPYAEQPKTYELKNQLEQKKYLEKKEETREMDKTIQKKNSVIKAKTNVIEQQSKTILSIGTQYAEMCKDVSNLIKEKNQTEQKINEANEEVNAYNQHKKELEEEIEEKESEKESKEEMLRLKEQEISETNKVYIAAQKELIELQKKGETLEKDFQTKESELEDILLKKEEELGTLKVLRQDINAEIGSYQKTIEDKNKECDAIDDKKIVLENEVDSLEQEKFDKLKELETIRQEVQNESAKSILVSTDSLEQLDEKVYRNIADKKSNLIIEENPEMYMNGDAALNKEIVEQTIFEGLKIATKDPKLKERISVYKVMEYVPKERRDEIKLQKRAAKIRNVVM